MDTNAPNLFWDRLLQLIAAGHVIPVIGQDLLTVKYKGKDELLYPLMAQELASYLGVSGEDLRPGAEINTVACRYIESGNGVEDVYIALKTLMPPDDELSIPEPLAKLAGIRPLKLFVTTTFDSLMVRAIDKIRFNGSRTTGTYSYAPNAVEDIEVPLKKLNKPAVFHLFGELSVMPDYAVTQEDTLEFLHSLRSEMRQPELLFDELNRNSLLILGCNFGDWLARFFIRTSKRRRLSDGQGRAPDYVADSRINSDANLVFFLNHFSSGTKIYESGNALDFIDELHRRWIERYPDSDKEPEKKPAEPLKSGYMEKGAVFVSYASEDRAAAVNIGDALKTEGVAVYLDVDRLEAGDDYTERLKGAIGKCSLFLPLISENVLTDDRRFFRIEWNQALEEAKKVKPSKRFIVPVVIDETPPTVPSVPREFRNLHWETLAGGQTNPSFLDMVKEEYEKFRR